MKRKLFLLSLILVFLFSGCQKKEELNNIHNAEKSNTGILNKGEILSVSGMKGYFHIPQNEDIIYYLEDAENKTVMCTQTGCKHQDNTCPAWYENIQLFMIHDDLWYVVENEEGVIDGTAFLVCTDPKSLKRETVCEWKGNKESQIGISSIYAVGDMFLCVLYENNVEVGTRTMYLDTVSVSDGKKTRIYTGEDGEMLRLAGAEDSKIILEISKINYDKIMNPDQFLEKYPDKTLEDFDAYYMQEMSDNREEVLKLYNLDGQEIKIISDTAKGYKGTPDNKIFCDEYTVYVCKDGVYLYNIRKDKKELLAQDKNIINCFILDGKVFYVVQKGDEYFYYYVDIETGTSTEQKVKNEDGIIPIGIHAESDDLFTGVSEKGIVSIKKKDYYAENYEKANLIIPFN